MNPNIVVRSLKAESSYAVRNRGMMDGWRDGASGGQSLVSLFLSAVKCVSFPPTHNTHTHLPEALLAEEADLSSVSSLPPLLPHPSS